MEMEMVISEPGNMLLFDAIKAQLMYTAFSEVSVTYAPQAARVGVVGDEDQRELFETIVLQLDPGAKRYSS